MAVCSAAGRELVFVSRPRLRPGHLDILVAAWAICRETGAGLGKVGSG